MDKPTTSQSSGKQYPVVSPLEYLEFSSKSQKSSRKRRGGRRRKHANNESGSDFNYTSNGMASTKTRNASRQSFASVNSTETTSTVGSLLAKLHLNEDGDEEVSSTINSPILEHDEPKPELDRVSSESNNNSRHVYLASNMESAEQNELPPGTIAIPASRFRSLRPVLESLKKKGLDDSAARSAMALGNKIGTVKNDLPVYNCAEDVQSIHVHPFRLSESSMDSLSTVTSSNGNSEVDSLQFSDTSSIRNNDVGSDANGSSYSLSTDRSWSHSYLSAEVISSNLDSRYDSETIDGDSHDNETPKVSPRKSKAVSISFKKAAGVHVVTTDFPPQPSVIIPQKPKGIYKHVHSFSNPVDTSVIRKSTDSMESAAPLSKTFHHLFYHATAPSPVTNIVPYPVDESPDLNCGLRQNEQIYEATAYPDAAPVLPMIGVPSRSHSFSSVNTESRARTVLKNAKKQRQFLELQLEEPATESAADTEDPYESAFDILSTSPASSSGPTLVENTPENMLRSSLEVQDSPFHRSKTVANDALCPSSSRSDIPLPRQASLRKLRGAHTISQSHEHERRHRHRHHHHNRKDKSQGYHHAHAYRELIKARTTLGSAAIMESSNISKSASNPETANLKFSQASDTLSNGNTTRMSSISSSSSSAKHVLRKNTSSSSGPSAESTSLPSSTSISSSSPLESEPRKLSIVPPPSSPSFRPHTHARIKSTSSFTTKPLPPQQESPIWKMRDSMHLDNLSFKRSTVNYSDSARNSFSSGYLINSPRTASALQTTFSATDQNTEVLSENFHHQSSSLTAESRVSMAIALRKSGNSKEATYHLQIAASQGNVEAMFLYGLSLRYGYGVPIQQRESFLWICESGDIIPDRAYNFEVSPKKVLMDLIRTNDTLTPKEPQTSVYFELGQAYLHGWGCAVSKRQALEFFELSGSLGYTDAMCEAGKMWTSKKLNGDKRDLARAAMWFRLAEKCGAELLGSKWFNKKRYD